MQHKFDRLGAADKSVVFSTSSIPQVDFKKVKKQRDSQLFCGFKIVTFQVSALKTWKGRGGVRTLRALLQKRGCIC